MTHGRCNYNSSESFRIRFSFTNQGNDDVSKVNYRTVLHWSGQHYLSQIYLLIKYLTLIITFNSTFTAFIILNYYGC